METALKKIFTLTLNREMMQNWTILLEFSSFGIHTPSVVVHCSGILPFVQITRRIFHRRSRNLGQFLYTLYEVPLGPGAAFPCLQTTSLCSFSWSSDISNCTPGFGRVYQDVTLSQLLPSPRVAVCLLQMMVSFAVPPPVPLCLAENLGLLR